MKTLARAFLVVAAIVFLTGVQTMASPMPAPDATARVHYLEIVAEDVEAQCAALESVHGISFGEPVADLGQAHLAKMPDGSMIGVRAPMAAHEQPIIRTYLEVADVAKALADAEAAGAMIAYGPAPQGDTGTWGIYILGGVQFGLWQK